MVEVASPANGRARIVARVSQSANPKACVHFLIHRSGLAPSFGGFITQEQKSAPNSQNWYFELSRGSVLK